MIHESSHLSTSEKPPSVAWRRLSDSLLMAINHVLFTVPGEMSVEQIMLMKMNCGSNWTTKVFNLIPNPNYS